MDLTKRFCHLSLTPSTAVKIFLVSGCLSLFVAQSYKELVNYERGLTSTAIYTRDVESPGFPTIVVCATEPYKKHEFIDTLDKYEKNTYSFEDIFVQNTFDGNNFTVETINTFYNGKCFVVNYKNDTSYKDWTDFKVKKTTNVTIYLVVRFQELCMIVGNCHKDFHRILPRHETLSVLITVGKKMWPTR
jgi:hypothetical protein